MATLAQQALISLNKGAFIFNNKSNESNVLDGIVYTLKDGSKIHVGIQSGNNCTYKLKT